MKNKLLSAILSITLTCSLTCGTIAPIVTAPITVNAAESVYDFDYGEGITWNKEDELPTFAPITATKENPMDSFVANDSMKKSDGCDQDPFAVPVKYAMVSLQGIVNRTRPQILIQESREEGQDVWPEQLVGKDNYKKTTDYISLIEKYKSYVKGLVVYNSDIVATRNVATSIAGAEDYLAVDHTLADELKKKCGLEVKVDLSKESSIKDTLSAYNYLYDNYYKTGKLNKRLLIGLNPDAHFPYNRDLAVATKSVVFWLEPDNEEERKVLDKFFDEATSGVTYNLGWWPSEDSGICYATKKGVASVPSDWFENMTVYMAGEKKFNIPEVPAKPKLENKIYVAMAVSDGDNAAYNEHAMRNKWKDEKRQTYPISWTTSPALYYCAPQMLNYYHETAGKDMLICGPSGMGYTKTTRWRNDTEFFQKNMASTEKLFEKTGLNIVTLWDRISEDCYDEYSQNMNCLLGVTINNNGFNDMDKDNADSMYNGKDFDYYPKWGELKYQNETPIMGLGWPYGYCSDEDCVDKMYDALKGVAEGYKGDKPEFKFAQFVTWVADPARISAMADKLNENFPGKFEFVRADHFFMLANEANNVPYNLALQQEVTASDTDDKSDATNANDGSITTGWADSESENKWYQVDLGTQSRITRYVLKNAETGYFENSKNTKSYEFQYSLDGLNWETADKVENNSEDILYKDLKDSVTARYVRIHILDAGSDDVARIQDLEVYGNPVDVTEAQLETLVNNATDDNTSLCENDNRDTFASALKDAESLLDSDKTYEDHKDEYKELYNKLAEAMQALSHKEVVDVAVEATCKATGLTEGSHCSVCEKILVKQEEIDKTEHTVVIDEAVEPTYTESGLTEGSHCSVCEEILVKQEVIPKLAADNTDAPNNPDKPDDTDNSDDTDKPGDIDNSDDTDKTDNTDNIEDTAPNDTDADDKIDDTNKPHTHTKVIDKSIAPTCTQSGLTEGSHCADCNETIMPQQFINATGHKTVTVNVVESTYFSDGYTGDQQCTVCNSLITKGMSISKKYLDKPTVTIKAGKKQMKITYKKVTDATGFEVSFTNRKKNYKKTFTNNKTVTRKIKSLKKGKYKVRVRAFIQSGDEKAYSAWTSKKVIKVK